MRKRKNILFLIIALFSCFVLVTVVIAIHKYKIDSDCKATQYVYDGDLIFINTTPDIKYTGNESCRDCHLEIYEAYIKSPTGRSMSILDSTNIIEDFPQKEAIYDTVNNFYYEMFEKDGKYYQQEYRLDNEGKLLHERIVEAQYVIGSGSNLRIYLFDENGMFYQLPLTWFVHKNKWDLSPGYREFFNPRFSRYISEMCFMCHNGYMEKLPDANDRYKKPYKMGISCEDCHGPGELHVKQCLGKKVKLPSPNALTIVNSPKLSPQRRNDICLQCHYEGKAWALTGDNGWFDFRPGKLLEEYRSIYSPATRKKNAFRVANSGYRMTLSRCYQGSHGNLACDMCHDSHGMNQVDKAKFNRQNCFRCHPIEGLPKKASRFSESREDCIKCHMNQTGDGNTFHGVVNHDHWIRINADTTDIDWSDFKENVDEQPLIKLIPDIDATDDQIDLRKGIAYAEMYWGEHDNDVAYLDSAKRYLLKGLKKNQTNPQVHYNLGRIWFNYQNYNMAIRHLKEAIKFKPDFFDAYFRLGHAYRMNKNYNKAIINYRKAIEFKPIEPVYLESLANTLYDAKQIPEAVNTFEESLEIDKQNPHVYYTLGNIYMQELKSPYKALDCFKEVVQLDPDFKNGYINLGNTYTFLGQYEKAIEIYQKEIKTRPNSGMVYLNLGHVYKLQGKHEDAEKAFEKARSIDPKLITSN